MAQIRYALAAARRLNFTLAAQDCNVSQPALTKAVKALEEELGAPLFHREGRRVLLSDFGRSMLPTLQRIMDSTDAARSLAESYRLLNHAPIRLGVNATLGHVRLARFVARFEAEHPGVELAIVERPNAVLAGELAEDRLDAVIANPLEGFGDRFSLRDLYLERYVVVLPPGHPLERTNAVTLADLDGAAYVDRLSCEMREMVMGVCAERGVSLYARFRSEREDWVQAMVLAGIGFAFMPEYSVSLPGLIQRPLVEPEVTRRIAIATMPGRRHTPALAAFLTAARHMAWPG
ncbi:LysR family transcriptional regulator [Halovulum dunhuangense]|uniref:LysR family transcriptional regulator n=1 Tax=Halovulum dunhuangense TaxID=1505036 RepID=A0A849L5V3_9RHOB|nr:LysR family transcriptional regulator [Halovulum dunhuangense]NNU81501.1 LysR family transcriptional regulator [Halovulum dunhuangense]